MSSPYRKVEGQPNLVKDTRSGAILNQDKKALEEYLTRREIIMTSKQNETKINNLEAELLEIKRLLKEALK